MFVVSRDLAMSSCLHLQIVSQAIHSIRSFSYSFSHVYRRTLFFFFLILSRTHARMLPFYFSIRFIPYNSYSTTYFSFIEIRRKFASIWIACETARGKEDRKAFRFKGIKFTKDDVEQSRVN